MLSGNTLFLRAVEKSDASTIFMWENNPLNWKISNTEVPFSMFDILQLIEQQSDLRKSGQLRLIMSTHSHQKPIGVIDLYEVNFKHGYASVGILIAETIDRGKGYASEALNLLAAYCKDVLELRNLQCSIHADNTASIQLFERAGFRQVGVRQNWLRHKGQFIDEISYQLCLNAHSFTAQ
ncbi:MAG: hypothetical protein RLZZ301_515 [Bacteroidota bacterium]|jgi:diamine N-acetyltransferase